ncbi:MAG TPA: hypothetical protein VFT79_11700 [Solirubrobacterales bacterium]|nr:hypothetical protein [Solirubrobacterales bacterium]
MSRRLRPIVLTVVAAALLPVPAAEAFSEVGNPCVGDDTEVGATMIALTNQGSEPFMQPNVPPEGKSVITRWRVLVGPGIGPLQQQLIASHQVGEEEDIRVGESAIETVGAGSNEFATRIPVSEYDHIGLRGPAETLICHREMNVAGRVKGNWATGETRHFEVLVHVGVPVVARVEPDRDGDGHGDETQDGCPTSAALQTPCPLLTVRTRREVKPNAILVRVTTSNESAVQVLGRVGWQMKARYRVFGLGEKTPRMIPAGGTGVFRLRLWPAVKRRLEQMPPRRSLRVKVAVGVTDAFGAVIRKRLLVRLPGGGEPR